ncbi:MAG: phosphatidylserine decarboxylase [Planctomycetota bacterium]
MTPSSQTSDSNTSESRPTDSRGIAPSSVATPGSVEQASSPADNAQSRDSKSEDLTKTASAAATALQPETANSHSGSSQFGPSEATIAMDPQLRTIQPGGGVVMSMELAWGRCRRRLLRRLRPGYVSRMHDRRLGQRNQLPIDPVDSRDMKFYRNQDSYFWADADDRFLWRDALPFMRVGLAELIVLGGGSLLLAVVMGLIWWPLALPGLVIAILVAWFFRNPKRTVPDEVGTVVAPADGKLVEIAEVEDDELGACWRFGIFLSIFNVHANRASLPGRVTAVKYRPGKMLNALRPESARENEHLDVYLAADDLDGRTIRIRQITGAFARRIVCWARVGDAFNRGEMYGMIKLGSRTELLIPRSDDLTIVAGLGDKVAAGSTVFAKYAAANAEAISNKSDGTS